MLRQFGNVICLIQELGKTFRLRSDASNMVVAAVLIYVLDTVASLLPSA